MKKYFLIAITALTTFMVSSCNKDNDDELGNPNGPWSVELSAQYKTISSYIGNNKFDIELAGTGTVTIDWGDGTVLETFHMPELKKIDSQSENENWGYEGTTYTHIYDKIGTYIVKVAGQGGSIVLLNVYGGNEKNGYASLVLNQCSQLQYLACGRNSLTALDVSQCPQLLYLHCENNQLTSLDVNRCTQLKSLDCGYNQLTSLDVNKNTQLEYLNCGANQLTVLDISKNTLLQTLSCGGNQLTVLDIDSNTQLTALWCGGNHLTVLDVSRNTQLEWLTCLNNQLASLDVSTCTQLKWLYCSENQLISLNISGCTQLEGLSCEGNRLSFAAMNKIYNDLPTVKNGWIRVEEATASNYHIAEEKGWTVHRWVTSE